MSRIVCYNKCISWGIVDEKIFVFNEDSKEIFVFKSLIKDIWVLINQTNDLNKVIDCINKEKSNDLSIEITDLIEKLIKKGLLHWKL